MFRLFAFAGGACLAAAVAVVALALPFVFSNAAPAEEQSPAGVSLDFDKKNGTPYIEWSRPIVAGMADDLRDEQTHPHVLNLLGPDRNLFRLRRRSESST